MKCPTSFIMKANEEYVATVLLFGPKFILTAVSLFVSVIYVTLLVAESCNVTDTKYCAAFCPVPR